MNIAFILFYLTFYLLYQFVPSGVYAYFALTTSLTLCYERLSIFLFLMFLLGIHNFLTPTRLFFPNSKTFIDFEFTLIGILVFISNDIELDICMDDNDVVFLQFTEYFFYAYLLLNSSCFLLYILWIFIYMIIRIIRYGESLSQQNILAFNNQDLRAHNNEGLNFHELNRLKQMKFDKNEANIRNKTCSICLNDFVDNENLIKLPECDHLFHNECIIDWLKMHLICPYCRCDIRNALQHENPLISRIQIEDAIEQEG